MISSSDRRAMPTAHMICGLPGCGESTLARRLERELGAARFTPDEWLMRLGAGGYDEAARARVEALQWEMAQRLLGLGVSVILENGFWLRAERDEYRRSARALGASVRLHYPQAPLAELRRRIAARNAAPPPCAFPIDLADLDAWAALFEAPTAEELGEGGAGAG